MQQTEAATDGACLACFLAAKTPQLSAEAFAEIVRRHETLVFSVCQRALPIEQDAQDAAQATFLTLAIRAERLTKEASVAAWLHHVARCICANMRKAAARRSQHEQEASAMRQQEQQHQQEMERLRAVLDEELDALPEKYRLPVILHHLQGHSIEDGARVLALNVGTFAARLSRGRERLRKRLTSHLRLASVLLPGLLTATGVIVPSLFAGTTAHAATLMLSGQTATLGTSALLAKGALKVMFYAKLKAVAAIVLIAALLGTGAVVAYVQRNTLGGGKGIAQASPAAATVTAEEKPDPSGITVTPRGALAQTAFDELRRKGLNVIEQGVPTLLVPVAMRFKPVGGRKFIEAVAATRGLKVAWERGGKAAILYPGASDQEVERVGKDMASADVSVRRDAVWRAGCWGDVRAVPVLMKAARDGDAEVARLAIIGLRRSNWDAALITDDSAMELIALELDAERKNACWSPMGASNVRASVARSLGRSGGEKALPLLEKALSDKGAHVRGAAAEALGQVGGEKALASLEKALADPDPETRYYNVRCHAASALGEIGGGKALALLEKALADKDPNVHRVAATSICRIADGSSLAVLEQLLADPEESVRRSAATALGKVGGEKALVRIEKALTDQDVAVRGGAVQALRTIVRDKALELLKKPLADPDAAVRRIAVGVWRSLEGETPLEHWERALSDQDAAVRSSAASGLGNIGGDKALALLAKALADPDATVRSEVAGGLGMVGATEERVLPLLEKLLADQDPSVRKNAINAAEMIGGEQAVVLLERALSDLDRDVRGAAVFALEHAGGEKALGILEKALADPDASVRSWTAVAIGIVGGEKALALLEGRLAGGDDHREDVIHGLGIIDGEKAVARLKHALTDSDSSVRQSAARELSELGAGKLLVPLDELLKNRLAQFRLYAAEQLYMIPEKETAIGLLKRALTDSDVDVRRNAVGSLGMIGLRTKGAYTEELLALLETALTDANDNVRSCAAGALGRIGGEKALARLEKALTDPDRAVRSGAACGMGQLGGERALVLLQKMLADQNVNVRRDATGMLGTLGQDKTLTEKVLPLLKTVLADKDAFLRGTAAEALGHIGGDKALALLEQAAADPDDGTRCSATIALENVVTRADTPDAYSSGGFAVGKEGRAKAFALLEKALGDRNWNVRSLAADALGQIGGAKACADLMAALKTEIVPEARSSILETLKSNFILFPKVKELLKNPPIPSSQRADPDTQF
ncbi:MAG: sigma-70 family RNA polymerase sigma factor [Planctomycetota bacterium]|nr:sigma-70 family RNA polymerase sigma factor [Planctomycetota bacterium]